MDETASHGGIADPSEKLQQTLSGTRLEDLPLDYIGSTSLGDLYTPTGLLGAGTFGVVVKVFERATGGEFALKVLPRLC